MKNLLGTLLKAFSGSHEQDGLTEVIRESDRQAYADFQRHHSELMAAGHVSGKPPYSQKVGNLTIHY